LLFSQINVNRDGSDPAASAMLEVKADNGGFLPPRVTLVQRDAIVTPAEGLMVFCTDCGYSSSGAISTYINGMWRLLAASCPTPAAPVAGTHVPAATQIIWNWNPVPGAAGYKWNTLNDYASATEMVAATTKTETGLMAGTLYTRYVWAYNACGGSNATAMTQATISCGSAITVNHVAGAVAAVTKTVTYGTATNIPGASTKCWITSNLGADHQANAVNDATEPSAGWYWQFNRKQGYKVEGSTRTPNTAWIDYISENSNWLPANDPCALELGNGWRIPTDTEWSSVDAGGTWTNWDGPWNSALKMHAAGYLEDIAGSLTLRGTYGFYWASVQMGNTGGWVLTFKSNTCAMGVPVKMRAFSIRCLQD
jgi:hypothetical protein